MNGKNSHVSEEYCSILRRILLLKKELAEIGHQLIVVGDHLGDLPEDVDYEEGRFCFSSEAQQDLMTENDGYQSLHLERIGPATKALRRALVKKRKLEADMERSGLGDLIH